MKREELEEGREYVWEPNHPHHMVRVRVDKVRGDRVFATTLTSTHTIAIGQKFWNDLPRFLEACVPASPTSGDSK